MSCSETLGLWCPLAAESDQRTGGGGRGKRGHTLAAARAHCTLAAARPRRGASGASLAPRLGPQHLRALRAAPRPRPRPADPPAPRAPRPHCSPFAGEKQQHPNNLQTVAQLVSTAEAPECCPSEEPGKENSLNNEPAAPHHQQQMTCRFTH